MLLLLTASVAVWLLIRSLYRWAGGIERKDGTRSHPGLGIPLLMLMPVIIGGPLLMYGIARTILPAPESREHVQGSSSAESREAIQIQRMKLEALSSPHVRWLLGEPELMIPVSRELTQKFGEAIRREIAETVETEEEVAGELRYLIEALQAR